jgi:hypothetical protein
MQLMQQWSEWQARRQHHLKVLFHTIMYASNVCASIHFYLYVLSLTVP